MRTIPPSIGSHPYMTLGRAEAEAALSTLGKERERKGAWLFCE